MHGWMVMRVDGSCTLLVKFPRWRVFFFQGLVDVGYLMSKLDFRLGASYLASKLDFLLQTATRRLLLYL
ncbi:hypothetical protein CHR53_26590 [Neobacillus mesonae]|uniref:Uncharacterized protein n=1 Tax=Neobacillus mesonae TaxID=1193713 RepID=A0A3Q9QYE4_9BACI|nr:hypothetical protein CHR53_26590 [Neobacillus mesonae]